LRCKAKKWTESAEIMPRDPIGRGVNLEMVINARQTQSRAAPKRIPSKGLTTVREFHSLYYYN
jgi:hypothetical protein